MTENFSFERIHDRIDKFGVDPVWRVAFQMARVDQNILATRDPFVLVPAIIFNAQEEHWENSYEIQEELMEEFPVSSQPTITKTASEIELDSCIFDKSTTGKGKNNIYQKNQMFLRLIVESSSVEWDNFKNEVMKAETVTPWTQENLR